MTNEYNFDDFIRVDKKEIFKSKVNRAGRGITISKDGLITFQALLADDLGMGEDKVHSLTFGMRDGQVLAIRLTEGSDGDVTNAEKKKKNTLSAKSQLRHLIEEHGTSEVKKRWLRMFAQKGNYARELDFNSYNYTAEYTDEETGYTDKATGLTRQGNDFFIDLMDGKGNDQDGTEKQGSRSS